MALSFSTPLSGLRASSNSLSIAGNNIANANTTAFKSGSASFSDVFLTSGTNLQIGNGVRTEATRTNFAQGSLTESSSPTSAAIQGNGFFVVKDSVGTQNYTRAGEFIVDRNGFLVTPSGERAQGYVATNGVITPGAVPSDVKVPIGQMLAPVTTTQETLRMNLKSSDAVGSVFHAPAQVYDSKGIAHTLDVIYTKTGAGAYNVSATFDGNASNVNGAATAPITFDAFGQLLTPAAPANLNVTPNTATLTPNGTVLPNVEIILRRTNPDGTLTPNLTSYDVQSAVASTDQNGYPSGSLTGLSFSADRDGTLSGIFSNGQSRPIAQLALANFNSQDGLDRIGGNLLQETLASGPPSIGTAKSGGRGDVVGGALEESNVDIATEFTDLIVAQRSFQANSRVITTVNQTLQELLQII